MEAVPIFSYGESEDLAQPEGRRSWSKLVKAEGRILLILLSCHQGARAAHSTIDISARQQVTWGNVRKIHADAYFWVTARYSRRNVDASLCWRF